MNYKMDYIKDKDTYKAVMYACKLMKPPYNKYYSDAIGIASNYYGVKYSDVQHYVSQRSGRKKGKTTGIKYKWFIVGLFHYWDTHDTGCNEFQGKIEIRRATKEENANKTLETTFKGYVAPYEYGEGHKHLMVFNNKEFATEKEATQYAKENEEIIMNWFKSKEYFG